MKGGVDGMGAARVRDPILGDQIKERKGCREKRTCVVTQVKKWLRNQKRRWLWGAL